MRLYNECVIRHRYKFTYLVDGIYKYVFEIYLTLYYISSEKIKYLTYIHDINTMYPTHKIIIIIQIQIH